MKKVGRMVLIFIGGLMALAAFAVLAVNLYVQAQTTQGRIQQELSQRLGTTLRVQRMSVTPWAGLKLTGITIPQAAGETKGQFLEAKTFRLRIHFASLFSRRLVIKEIALEQPTVIWLQNADGKWRIPPMPDATPADTGARATGAKPTPARAAAPTPTTKPAPTTAASSPVNTPMPAGPAPASEGSPETPEPPAMPEIRRVNLSDGHLRFLDARGKVVAIFDGVQFRSNFRNAAAVKGSLGIAKTSLRDRFFLQQLQSRLEYGPKALEMSDVTAKAGGGDVTGSFTMQPETVDSPFRASVRFHDVHADQIVAEAGGPAGVVTGKLEGFLDATGKTADANALAGIGEINLRDGQLRRYSVLEALGQLLQIEELRQLRLDDAHVKYRISPGVVSVDELLLRSANLRLSATGTISFEGKLQLAARLAVNETIRQQLFRAIRENFQPIDEPGFSGVDFEISGTVDRPKSNLMEKVVGHDLKDIGGVINSLFGGKSERPKKNKKPRPDAPANSPEPSPPPAIEPMAAPSTTPSAAEQPTAPTP